MLNAGRLGKTYLIGIRIKIFKMTTKRNQATIQQRIEMAKDCLFSSATIPQLETKWGVTCMTIFRHTKTYDFKYFKKQNRKHKIKPV